MLGALYQIPIIVSTEPEQGPNTDLLGTSPKASLGQYATWQVWVAGRGWASSVLFRSLLLSHVN